MLEKGYITSFQEAFNKYLGHGGPAYVERDKMTPEEAVGLVLRTDGLPVLAHPLTTDNPEMIISRLKKTGLVGIEVYYKDYTAAEIESLVALADRLSLIATGGTDYHGLDDADEVMMGGTDVPVESARQLIALAEKRGLKSAIMSA
jgi:predicted metal-dependent phosphoesterase TrpH